MRHLVTIDRLEVADIERILDRAQLFESNPNRALLEGKVVATLFLNPPLVLD